ncbi:hypothetical protein DPMN_135545 [Dreissena polymorpha]|uniref:Uncharacterized protein n=1 Tax=Dreissena polymorpha TaxID=45954 RepID=A0A9D4G245_DREPO|nr:hypothetical protein DPMN_135545 [Dreissena polymorpha]
MDGVESDFDNVKFSSKTYNPGDINVTFVQSKNTLVLTDRLAHTVYMYDIVKGTARIVTDENIQQPTGACVGLGDTVLLCIKNNPFIVHLTVEGDILTTYPVDMKYP